MWISDQAENDAINVLLNRAVGGAQFALMMEQEDTESGIAHIKYYTTTTPVL